MTIQLGTKKKEATGELVDLLLECHGRIRTFSALARTLGETKGVPADEVKETAARVRRYFFEALPLHVRDEEETILPRLRGASPEVDRALAAMQSEHHGHEPLLEELRAICDDLIAHPDRHAARAERLAHVARHLEADFATHLDAEERIVFPALARLAPDLRAQMIGELRARRTPR